MLFFSDLHMQWRHSKSAGQQRMRNNKNCCESWHVSTNRTKSGSSSEEFDTCKSSNYSTFVLESITLTHASTNFAKSESSSRNLFICLREITMIDSYIHLHLKRKLNNLHVYRKKTKQKSTHQSTKTLHQRQTCRSTYCHESSKTKYPKKKQIPFPVKCLYWGLPQLAQSKGSQDCKHLLVVHEVCFAKPKEFKRIRIEGLTGKRARVTNWPWNLNCPALLYFGIQAGYHVSKFTD